MSEVGIPTAYEEGYAKASAIDPDLARAYIELTTVGDPVADAAIDSLGEMDQGDANRFIRAGIHEDAEVLARAPETLQRFFRGIEGTPNWFDPAATRPGCQAFHSHSDLFIPAFFVVTLRNASSLIAKAFYATGRVVSGFGLRRIRQNTRHFIEIMLPHALERHGDGWRLSVRIRLVHAQVRNLIRDSGGWDEAKYGVPLSSAHMGLASSNFSVSMLRHAEMLGARMDAETRQSFMQIWRYASHLGTSIYLAKSRRL